MTKEFSIPKKLQSIDPVYQKGLSFSKIYRLLVYYELSTFSDNFVKRKSLVTVLLQRFQPMSECSQLFLAANCICYQGGYNEHSPANWDWGKMVFLCLNRHYYCLKSNLIQSCVPTIHSNKKKATSIIFHMPPQ